MLFEQFINNINEAVTAEQRDKAISKVEEWAKKEGYKINKSSIYHDQTAYIIVHTPTGAWSLNLEAATKKSGQDSMYRQTYTRDSSNLKWYIQYPGRTNSYNYRSNTKPGSPKTFIEIIEAFKEPSRLIMMYSEFLELIDDEYKFSDNNIHYSGKNLKALGISFMKLTFNREKGYYFNNMIVDPEKGEFLLQALNSFESSHDKKEAKNGKIVREILEILKDKPLDNVWDEIKNGNWKELANKYRGTIQGKNFGI